MALKIFLIFVSLALCIYGYQDCSNQSDKVKFESVKVDDCDVNKGRCTVKRGTDVKITITFTSSTDFDRVKVKPYFIKDGQRKYITLDNYNACTNSGITCPIKQDQTYTYQTLLSIYKMREEKDIKWKFEDENNNDLFCVMISLKMVD